MMEESRPIRQTSGVWLCPACGGLQLGCGQSQQCRTDRTLNRPFVRYCRRCPPELRSSSPPWQAAAEGWLRASVEGWDRPCRGFEEPELVADLSVQQSYEMPSTRVALAPTQGMLALHATHSRGDSLALLHGLTPEGHSARPAWRAELPKANRPGGSAEVPFDPVLLPGARYLVFARPSRLLLLDLWNCGGLSLCGPEPPPLMFDLEPARLAASPVPLGEGTLGLLILQGDQTYRWVSWDFQQSPAPTPDQIAGAVALALEGGPCQVELIDGRALAIMTPRGHWVWAAADAAASKTERLERTWPHRKTLSGQVLLLDVQAERPRSFREPRQVWSVLSPGSSASFDWFYRVHGPREDGQWSEWVENYEVRFDTREPSDVDDLENERLVPIGVIHPQGAGSEVLFREGDALVRRTSGGWRNCSQGLPPERPGLRVFGPLVVLIAMESGRQALRVATTLTDETPSPAYVAGRLGSDPVLWSRWLFTVEHDDEAKTVVRRRRLIDAEPDGTREPTEPRERMP